MIRIASVVSRAIVAVGTFIALGQAASAQDNAPRRAMIVFDGSGSMWGQIKGEAKISIARKVLGDVLVSSPKELHLGLMAYGHREKGNCKDIEILIAPAPGAGAEISGMADAIKPKGKTPLSDAVRMAAESLRYTEQKADVILITDGIETCKADPCAVASELEKAGVDFTAHVVGFGLSAEEGKQVACLAENTGGRYLQADDAASLGDALRDTVIEVAAPSPVPDVAPEPEPETLPAASITAQDSVEIGRRFPVTWDGPNEKWDRIIIYDPKAANGEGREVAGRLLRSGDVDKRVVDLIAPVRLGTYQLQYRYSAQGHIIATRKIEVVDALVSLDAPATAAIGKSFTVRWVGPGGRHDRISLVDPAEDGGRGEEITGKRLSNGDVAAQTVDLVGPVKPGFYQLQYYDGSHRAVLATRQIEILDAPVSLQAPETAGIGSEIEVIWEGPGGRKDRIEVFDAAASGGKGAIYSSKRLTNGDFANKRVRVKVPTQPGTYEIRYFNGDNLKVLVTRPITVEAVAVAVSAPDAAPMGSHVTVGWQGPGANRDRIELVETQGGKVISAARLSNGDTAKQTVGLLLPVTPGAYEVRYQSGDSGETLASRPIIVSEVETGLEAPAEVKAGESFKVRWRGPGANRDAVQIIAPNARRALVSRRLAVDDFANKTVTLKAPEAGDYILRYWSGHFTQVLAEVPITVR